MLETMMCRALAATIGATSSRISAGLPASIDESSSSGVLSRAAVSICSAVIRGGTMSY